MVVVAVTMLVSRSIRGQCHSSLMWSQSQTGSCLGIMVARIVRLGVVALKIGAGAAAAMVVRRATVVAMEVFIFEVGDACGWGCL